MREPLRKQDTHVRTVVFRVFLGLGVRDGLSLVWGARAFTALVRKAAKSMTCGFRAGGQFCSSMSRLYWERMNEVRTRDKP